MVTQKNLVVQIVLTILTFGLYGFFWLASITDDVNELTGRNGTSGFVTVLFCILICGIYRYVWYYKTGKELYNAGDINGVKIADNAVLCLVLGFFVPSVVIYAIMQSDLNTLADI